MGMKTVTYRRASVEEKARLIIEMPKTEVEAIDRWGVPAGMASRTAAIRELIRQGLTAVSGPTSAGSQAAGQGS